MFVRFIKGCIVEDLCVKISGRKCIIPLPCEIKSDFRGFSFLSNVQRDILYHKSSLDKVEVDFNKCEFFEGNLYAVLGAILTLNDDRIRYSLMNFKNRRVKDLIIRNRFAEDFHDCNEIHCNGKHYYYDSTIQYKTLKSTSEYDMNLYIINDVLKTGIVPDMTEAARKKMASSISEVINNAIHHGDTRDVFICGQYFKEHRDLKLTIVDLGRSIPVNVNKFLKQNKTACEAIEWAISGGNTTRARDKKTPGGLGLKVLRQFLKMNKGTLQIVSKEGFMNINGNEEINYKTLSSPFQGTIVNIIFKTDDEKTYKLVSEV